MKSNAPEKIYLQPYINGKELIRPWLTVRFSQDSVEYTRTDAFIEKAVKWLHTMMQTHAVVELLNGEHYEKELINHFRKAMEE